MGNTFGTIYKLTSYGESHGPMIGGIIEGCPSSFSEDFSFFSNLFVRKTNNLINRVNTTVNKNI